nr:GNAT family N-acetyltransferase [Variovorax dokdonensis]
MSAQHVEAIERATLAAVAPEAVDALQDDAGANWLLPFDPGTVGRAHSAVPLSHDRAPDDAAAWIAQVQARYAAHGLPTRWRLADVAAFDDLRQALGELGYRGAKPTLTHTALAKDVLDAFPLPGPDSDMVRLDDAPDEGWARVFLGPGFDPVDAASRVKSLSRGSGNRFASARLEGRTVAVGALSVAPQWAGVHGLRTEQALRGQGLAGRILRAMAFEAVRSGVPRIFLQVEEGNAPALALYRRAGFDLAWRYRYWARPD